MKTVDKDSLEKSLLRLVPQLITEPGKVSVQVSEDWLDDEESIEPTTVIGVHLYTEAGRFQTNYRTFKSLLGSLYIQEQLAKLIAPSLLESLVNAVLKDIPSNHGPAFVIDTDGVASDIVRQAGTLPMHLAEAIDFMDKALAFSLEGTENTSDIEYLPVISEDNSTKVSIIHKSLEVTIFDDVWYGGVALTNSSSGRLVPSLSYFMVRDSDNYVVTLPGVNLKYSVPKNGATPQDGQSWLEDAVGMAASVLPSEMERVAHLSSKEVESDLPSIIKDILKTIQLPQSQRARVVSDVINDFDNPFAYGLLLAVGRAQLTDELSFAILDKTQQAAGKVLGVLGHRCNHCHQLTER